MDQMFEIYKSKADLYDALVNHEDYQNNLPSFLNEKIDFAKKTICEFGVGTGRVTKYYLDKVFKAQLYDVSTHMLERAGANPQEFKHKINFEVLDNNELFKLNEQYDIAIEGWSFGHLITQDSDLNIKIISDLMDNCIRIAKKVVIIETLGTNVEKPKPPSVGLNQFYEYLTNNGFKEYVVKTDYKYETIEQAQYVMGSFFGTGMEASIKEKNSTIIPEFTGVWIN